MRLVLLHLLAGKSYAIAVKDERHRLRPAPAAPLTTCDALACILFITLVLAAAWQASRL